MSKNIGSFFLQSVKKYHQQTAICFQKEFRADKITYQELGQLAQKAAAFLKENGLKKKDKVAILGPNSPQWVIAFFATLMTGGVAVPIGVRSTESLIFKLIKKVKPKIIFLSRTKELKSKLPARVIYLEDLFELIKENKLLALEDVNPHDLAEIIFTSGTTAEPKGVMLSHQNILVDLEGISVIIPKGQDFRCLSILPLSHAYEGLAGLLLPLKCGATIYYLQKLNPASMLQAFQEYKVTHIALVPQILRIIYQGIEDEIQAKNLGSVWKFLNKVSPLLPMSLRHYLFYPIWKKLGGAIQFIGCGGSPLDVKLARAWERLGIPILEAYGATETTAGLTINTLKEKRLGSVGKAIKGAQIKIASDGEILAKGPMIFQGYFKAAQKTKAVFKNGFYKTGDIGYFDQDGFLYIKDRKAFRIVLESGKKVYPQDVEKALNFHPLIDDSCVVGVEKGSKVWVHAFLRTKQPELAGKIINEINQGLESYQQIGHFSVWSEKDFPRLPNLKKDRNKLTQIAGKGLEKQVEEKVGIGEKQELEKILSRVCRVDLKKVKNDSNLVFGLKLDSLGRLELLARIEKKYRVVISELEIDTKTTVAGLKSLIEKAPQKRIYLPSSLGQFSALAQKIRFSLFKFLVFPIHSFFFPIIKIKGQKNLEKIKSPVVFIYNHVGRNDVSCVLKVLPDYLLKKIALAATSEAWRTKTGSFWVSLFGGFPIDKYGTEVGSSFKIIGKLLDKGFNIIIAPEGQATKDGSLGKFKPGVGFIAIEMKVPVVPIKIIGDYHLAYPGELPGKKTPLLPQKRAKIEIVIGQPISFSSPASYQEAVEKLFRIMKKM